MAGEQQAPAPAEGGGEGGGGVAEVLQKLDQGLLQVTQALAQSQGAPEGAKEAFAASLAAFRQGLEILTSDGGGARAPQQTTTPEQGANPNAVPMSHGRPG